MTMKRATVVSAAIALAALSTAFAQTVDFSGSWQLDKTFAQVAAPPPNTAAPGTSSTIARGGNTQVVGLESGMGEVGNFRKSRPAELLVITQTATEIRLEERWKATIEGGAYREFVTYKLDGTEGKNLIPGRGESVTKTSWESGKLLIKGTLTAAGRGGRGGRGSEVNEALYLSADGRELTLERTTASRGGGNTTTLIFKKAAGG